MKNATSLAGAEVYPVAAGVACMGADKVRSYKVFWEESKIWGDPTELQKRKKLVPTNFLTQKISTKKWPKNDLKLPKIVQKLPKIAQIGQSLRCFDIL